MSASRDSVINKDSMLSAIRCRLIAVSVPAALLLASAAYLCLTVTDRRRSFKRPADRPDNGVHSDRAASRSQAAKSSVQFDPAPRALIQTLRTTTRSGSESYRRNTAANSTLHPPRAGHDSTPGLPARQNRRLLAVGYFSREQLVAGCRQFASLVHTGAAWERDIVKPTMLDSQFVGLAGARERRAINHMHNYSSPRQLEDYFNLQNMKSHLQDEKSKLVPQTAAERMCKGKWNLLYLMPKARHEYLLVCPKSTEQAQKSRTFLRKLHTTLPNSVVPQLAIVANCGWIVECMPESIRQFGPFPKVVCAAIPDQFRMQWNASDIASDINMYLDECMMITHWYGLWRHDIRELPARFAHDWFGAAETIQHTAHSALVRAGLSRGAFTAVHIRMEYIFRWCDPSKSPPYHCRQPSDTSVLAYFGKCLTETIETIKNHSRIEEKLLLALDLMSDSMSNKRKQIVLHPEQTARYIFSRLKQTFANTVLLNDFVANYDDTSRELMTNRGLRALLDAEILMAASTFYAVGGGNFQSRIVRLRERNSTKLSCQYGSA
eukprot:scpid55720/ scgid11865/ 